MPKSKKGKWTNSRYAPYKKQSNTIIHRVDVDSKEDIEIGHNKLKGSVSSAVFTKNTRVEITDKKNKEDTDQDLDFVFRLSYVYAKDSTLCIFDKDMLFEGSLYVCADGDSLVTVAVPDGYCVMVRLKDTARLQIIGANCRIQSIDRSPTSRLDIVVPSNAKNINISSNSLSSVSGYSDFSQSSSECFSSTCSETEDKENIASSSKNVLIKRKKTSSSSKAETILSPGKSPLLLSCSSSSSQDDPVQDFSDTIKDPINTQELVSNNNNNHMLYNLSSSSSDNSLGSITSYQPPNSSSY